MCSADQISGSVNIQKFQDDVVKLWNVVKSRHEISEEEPHQGPLLWRGPLTTQGPRQPPAACITSVSADKVPLLHLKRRMGTQWEYDSNLPGVYFGVLHNIATIRMRLSRCTTIEYYQVIFQHFGSRGCALTLAPFNQGSKQDVEAFVDHIYISSGLDLDYIIPFAAIPENGREIDGLDESEVVHCIMLVNLLRLLGAVKTEPDTSELLHLTEMHRNLAFL
ncbi:hypothetical protein BC827DRAFT_1186272, partial [Russula dissimulans]